MNKINKHLEGDAGLRTMYWFFDYPEVKITLSELAKELEISKKTANRVVAQLVKDNFLMLEEVGRAWRISCNQNHPYNRTIKIGYNLMIIYGANIVDWVYKTIGSPRAIILFGSYRKGDNNSSSDVDIAAEAVGNKELEIINLGKFRLGSRKNVTVNLHIFSRNKVDLNLFANIANGIVLDGFLEVRP
ncbi:MAG: nucleotidyltransferase domain-containing protein [Nanoarchaeota archaeon]